MKVRELIAALEKIDGGKQILVKDWRTEITYRRTGHISMQFPTIIEVFFDEVFDAVDLRVGILEPD